MWYSTDKIISLALLLIVLCANSARAQTPTKESLGIGAVKVIPSLIEATQKVGKFTELSRVVEAMDSQMIDRFHNTRKFTIVSRSDLAELMKEQGLAASGNLDSDDAAAAQAFKLAGCKYLLVTSVDSFQDYEEKATFEGIGEKATKRVIQFSAVGKIYDATSGKLLESANFQLDNKDIARNPAYVAARGQLNEKLLAEMARMMADKIANRVVDVLYPAKVVAKTDRIVTINRGDGTGVATGQVWEVYALGEEMIDPDTQASLGREEVCVGAVKITSVQPMFSKAEVMDDKGVDKGHILRLVLQKQHESADSQSRQ